MAQKSPHTPYPYLHVLLLKVFNATGLKISINMIQYNNIMCEGQTKVQGLSLHQQTVR